MLMIKKNGIFITIITQNAIQQNIIWNVEDIEFSWLKKYNKSLVFYYFGVKNDPGMLLTDCMTVTHNLTHSPLLCGPWSLYPSGEKLCLWTPNTLPEDCVSGLITWLVWKLCKWKAKYFLTHSVDPIYLCKRPSFKKMDEWS